MLAKLILCALALLGGAGAAAKDVAHIHIDAVIYKMSEDEMKYESVVDFFGKAEHINVFVEGMPKRVEKDSEEFARLQQALENITKESHEMPAFGVSIDALTKDDMKTGTWLELCFGEEQKHEGMSFDSLLIRVEKEHYGFNLIRGQAGRYDGRCFYLSLESNMSELYDAIGAVFGG